MGALGGSPDGVLVAALIFGNAAGRLRSQRRRHLVKSHLIFRHIGRFLESFFHISPDNLPPGAVRLEILDSVIHMVSLESGVNLHCPLLQGILRGKDGFQLFIFHVNQVQSLRGDLLRVRRHQSHNISHKIHLIFHQKSVHRESQSPFLRHILMGYHRPDAGKGLCL